MFINKPHNVNISWPLILSTPTPHVISSDDLCLRQIEMECMGSKRSIIRFPWELLHLCWCIKSEGLPQWLSGKQPAMQEMQEMWVRSLGQEDPLEKSTATHSSILAWRIPWTGRPAVLQSMGSQRVGHAWATELNWTEAVDIPSVFPAGRRTVTGWVPLIEWSQVLGKARHVPDKAADVKQAGLPPGIDVSAGHQELTWRQDALRFAWRQIWSKSAGSGHSL